MANVVEIVLRALDKTKEGFTGPLKNFKLLSSEAGSLGGALDKIKPAVLTLASVTATAFAVMAKHSVNVADEFGKMAQKAGTTSEIFSSLAYSGSLAGLEAERLQKSYKELSKLIEESNDPSSKAASMFRSMGVEFEGLNGKVLSADELMLNIADRFADTADGASKVSAATKLFGDRLGQDMIPFLNQGSAGIRELQQEAVLFGQVVSTKTAKAAEEFNDDLTRLKAIIQGVVNQVVAEFLPAAAEMLTAFINWIKQSGAIQFAVGTLIDIFKTLAYVVKLVITAFSALADIFVGIGEAIGKLASTIVDAFGLIGSTLGRASAVFEEVLKGNFSNAEEMAHQAFSNIQQDAINLLGGIPGIAKSISESLANAFKTLSNGPTPPTFGEHQDSDGTIRVQKYGEEEGQITAIHQKWQSMRELMDEAANEGQITRFMALQDTMSAMEAQRTDERKQFIQQYATFYAEAHRGAFSYIAEAAKTVYQGIGNAITSIVTGAKSAGQAFADLGKQMIAMVINFMAQRVVAFALEKVMAVAGLGLLKAAVVTNTASAAALAAAWAPAATAAAIATFGGALAAGAGVPTMMAVNAAAGSAIALAGSLGGVAHAGATMIPEEATYLLKGGERVLAPEQNQDLTQFLNQGGGPTSITVNLDGAALGKGIGQISRDGRLEIDVRSIV